MKFSSSIVAKGLQFRNTIMCPLTAQGPLQIILFLSSVLEKLQLIRFLSSAVICIKGPNFQAETRIDLTAQKFSVLSKMIEPTIFSSLKAVYCSSFMVRSKRSS